MENNENNCAAMNRLEDTLDRDNQKRQRYSRFRAEKRTHKETRNSSSGSSLSSRGSHKRSKEPETDPDVLSRRQKQIDYGKNSVAYDKYTQQVPKESRHFSQPRTPDK